MQHYLKTFHAVYDIKLHLVWITKYRKPVLLGDVAIRLRELIREICKSMDVEIIKGHVSKDHLRILVSSPPKFGGFKVDAKSQGQNFSQALKQISKSVQGILGTSLSTNRKLPPYRR